MNTYEALVIYKPTVDSDNSEAPVRIFEQIIRQNKGKVLHTDKVGRKRLAFDVENFKDGYIGVFVFQLSPNQMVNVTKACHLHDEIIRLSVIRYERFDASNPQSTTSTVTSKELRERDLARSGARAARAAAQRDKRQQRRESRDDANDNRDD